MKQDLPCLTIIVPALNEEEAIALTVTEILPTARCVLNAFEIILINDGSSDRTGKIMETFAQEHPEVRVIHNPKPRGLGCAFQEGIARAHFDSLAIIPGDHAYNIEGLRRVFEVVGSADLIIGYRTNQSQARTLFRTLLSYLFRFVMNILFGYRLKDLHGMTVYPVQIVRELELRSVGYTFQLEMLVKLLRRRISFVEVPVSLNSKQDNRSRSLRLKTLLDVVRMAWHLFWSRS